MNKARYHCFWRYLSSTVKVAFDIIKRAVFKTPLINTNTNTNKMDKKAILPISELVAFNSIQKPEKGEKFEAYVKRVYSSFERYIIESDVPVMRDLQGDCKDLQRNAISKLAARARIVELFCAINDPFLLEAPKDASDDDILAHNGVEKTSKELLDFLGKDGYASFMKTLKQPKKDGLSARAVSEKREQHYAKYEPCYPSAKTVSVTGTTTRGFHWDSKIQALYVEDHANFLNAYNLTDSFPVIEEVKETAKTGKGEQA